MVLIIIAIIAVGIAEYWLYRKYTAGGIPLAVAIIITQIAAVALWRIAGPFGLFSRTGIILLALTAAIVALFWAIAIQNHRRQRRQRNRRASSAPDPISQNPGC